MGERVGSVWMLGPWPSGSSAGSGSLQSVLAPACHSANPDEPRSSSTLLASRAWPRHHVDPSGPAGRPTPGWKCVLMVWPRLCSKRDFLNMAF